MTTEAAILGTPAIFTHQRSQELSNFIELESDFGLIFNIKDIKRTLNKATQLINNPNLDQIWKKKREKLLKEKIDFSAFLMWFVENYPESHNIMKENPDYQNKFK
jgi:hypothetical protein